MSHPQGNRTRSLLIFAAALAVSGWGTAWLLSRGESRIIHAANSKNGPALSYYMGDMQRYSMKLGYSIEAENKELAKFYTGEIKENIRYIKDTFPQYDGLPIGGMIGMLEASVRNVDRPLDSGDWPQSKQRYGQMISVCNACHAATRRHFVKITPATGTPPFNQKFD